MRPSAFYISEAGGYSDAALDDLLVSKSRWLVIISAIFMIGAAIIISGTSSTKIMAQLYVLSMSLAIVSTLAYRMLDQRYLLAHLLWQISLVVMILGSCILLREAEIIFLAALLPLISAITLGLSSGVLSECLVIGMVLWLQAGQGIPTLSLISAEIIPIFGAFGCLLGWITTSHLMKAANWALYSFQQAQTHLSEARQERQDLKQSQADLSKANQELARLASRMKILQRIAEESRQAKTEFVSNVSHELRTPLNMIIGFTEVITKSPQLYGGRLSTALMADISAIQRNSQHLLTLVNDVLDLSQVEAGQMALSKEWSSVDKIVQSAMEVVQGLYDSKGLYLSLEEPEPLPQVFCDQIRVRQVIINLLSNAGRFTTHGGVKVRCESDQEKLVIKVADTGPGIPEDEQARIFEPFQQLDNSTRRLYGGSGLGLAICRQFINLHGGKMWLESLPGQGTTFLFSLPISTALGEEEAHANQNVRRSLIPGDEYGYSIRTQPSKAPPVHPLPRLVVLEKGQALQRLLTRYLKDTEITVTNSLAEVEQALSQSPAQALLVNTPHFEDLSAEALMITPFSTPVISCWVPGEKESATHLGAFQYLLKPVTREKLLSVLDELLQSIQFSGTTKQVLVVDDEPDELHLFARMLESASQDYHVLQVTNGKRALDIMRSRKVDILLLDLMLPGMTGFQVLDEMHKDPKISAIPVIIISSRDPQGEAIISNSILISHNGGFSTRHLLNLIQSAIAIILPESVQK